MTNPPEKAPTTKMDEETILKIRELTGEGNYNGLTVKKITIDYRNTVPYTQEEEAKKRAELKDISVDNQDTIIEKGIKNTNYGGFVLHDSEKIPLGKSLDVIILKKRMTAKYYDKKNKSVTYYTKEFDNWIEPIELYDQDSKVVAKQRYGNLKVRYDIKAALILYVYYKKEVHRFQCSASSFFTFQKFKETLRNTSFCMYNTQITTSKVAKTDTSPSYFVAEFKVINPNKDLKPTFKLIKDLHSAFALYSKTQKGNIEQEEEIALPPEAPVDPKALPEATPPAFDPEKAPAKEDFPWT